MKYNIEVTLTDTHCDGVYWLGNAGNSLCVTSEQLYAKRFGSEGEAFSFARHMFGVCTDHKIVSHGTWVVIPAPDTF